MPCLAWIGVGLGELLMLLGLIMLIVSIPRLLTTGRLIIWVFHDLTGNTRQSQEAERKLGRELAKSLLHRMPADDDKRASRVVTKVGTRLTQASQGTDFAFCFRVVRSSQLNAFAVPGGYVFVTNSLFSQFRRSDDEIAFILAHEMSHILLCHPRDRITGSCFMGILTSLVFGCGPLATWLRQLATRTLTAAYSRDQELEADRNAVRLMRKAGFDPHRTISVLETLRQSSQTGADDAESYFASHPPVELRIRALRQLVEQEARES